MSDKVHVTFNLVMDLHIELERWMARVHVPRKVASRIEDATASAAISLSSATMSRRDFNLSSARNRLIVTRTLLEQLGQDGFLSPHLHLWAKKQIDVVIGEIDNWDPTRMVPMMRPRKRERPRPMLN